MLHLIYVQLVKHIRTRLKKLLIAHCCEVRKKTMGYFLNKNRGFKMKSCQLVSLAENLTEELILISKFLTTLRYFSQAARISF